MIRKKKKRNEIITGLQCQATISTSLKSKDALRRLCLLFAFSFLRPIRASRLFLNKFVQASPHRQTFRGFISIARLLLSFCSSILLCYNILQHDKNPYCHGNGMIHVIRWQGILALSPASSCSSPSRTPLPASNPVEFKCKNEQRGYEATDWIDSRTDKSKGTSSDLNALVSIGPNGARGTNGILAVAGFIWRVTEHGNGPGTLFIARQRLECCILFAASDTGEMMGLFYRQSATYGREDSGHALDDFQSNRWTKLSRRMSSIVRRRRGVRNSAARHELIALIGVSISTIAVTFEPFARHSYVFTCILLSLSVCRDRQRDPFIVTWTHEAAWFCKEGPRKVLGNRVNCYGTRPFFFKFVRIICYFFGFCYFLIL